MRYLIVLALGIAIGSFGVVASIKFTGNVIRKGIEVSAVVVDSVTPAVKEGYQLAEKGIEKVSK